MPPQRFGRYQLRTKDLHAARDFYADLLGPGFWGAPLTLSQLPPQAAARGAPAHWLGQIVVDDVEAAASRMAAAGAQQLGPIQRDSDGAARAALRDPFGAVFAVGSLATAEPPSASSHPVVFHLLNVLDHQRAWNWYAGLFDWTAQAQGLGPALAEHQAFSWHGSADQGDTAGAVANTASQPGVHPHWLFCFKVPDLDAAAARVQAAGGKALPPRGTSRGDRIAPCDDPQGAAFGLFQPG